MEDEGMSAPKQQPSRQKLEIEYIVRTRTVFGTRIHANGRSEETHDGANWEPLVQLSPAAMDELRTTAAEGGFFDLPANIQPEPDVRGGTTLVWSVSLGPRNHTVTARKGTNPLTNVLTQFAEVVERVVGTELNRIADSGSE